MNIVIADDHSIVREGIKIILCNALPNIDYLGEAQDGREVLQIAQEQQIDLFILDVTMPKLNGLEAARRLLKLSSPPKIIMLSMHDDRASVEKALESGVHGYLVKDNAVEELAQAIADVLRGDIYLSPSVAKFRQSVFHGKRQNYERSEAIVNLTEKEKEVLQLLAEGYTSKEIAGELDIAFNTVNVHRSHIMQKLDLHKSADLVRYAIKEGMIRS